MYLVLKYLQTLRHDEYSPSVLAFQECQYKLILLSITLNKPLLRR